jgi:hypothetical protein
LLVSGVIGRGRGRSLLVFKKLRHKLPLALLAFWRMISRAPPDIDPDLLAYARGYVAHLFRILKGRSSPVARDGRGFIWKATRMHDILGSHGIKPLFT